MAQNDEQAFPGIFQIKAHQYNIRTSIGNYIRTAMGTIPLLPNLQQAKLLQLGSLERASGLNSGAVEVEKSAALALLLAPDT